MARSRLNPPRVAEILAGAFGVVLLVSLFLPWYRTPIECVQGPCPSQTVSAFGAFAVLDLFLLVVALGGVMLLVVEMTQRTPALATASASIAAPLSFVAFALVLWRTLSPPGAAAEPLFAFLGLIAAGGLTVAFLLSMRNEGLGARGAARTTLPDPLPAPRASTEDER